MDNNIRKFKIGYIDEESQWVDRFVLRLKEAFDVFIFKLTPETTLTDMIEQIEQAKLDCLVVDFDLKEADLVQFNGDEVIDTLRSKYPFFPVFIITAKEEDDVLSQVEDNDIVRLKEELDKKPAILIQRIQNKINSYYRQVNDAENTVRGLIEKRNVQELSIPEEELLTDKYLFLDKINPDDKILPDNLIQHESITKLKEFAFDTKQILEELKKLSK